ncbi:MAG: rhomboid family intramembrane serine protease, partial [Pseudomonadota bacterium]
RSLGEVKGRDEAKAFVNALASEDIDSKFDSLGNDSFEIWIFDEDDMPTAMSLLEEFNKTGLNDQFQEKAKAGKDKIRESSSQTQSAVYGRAQVFNSAASGGLATTLIIGVCILLYFLEFKLGKSMTMKYLYIADLTGGMYRPGLMDVRSGEVWRLVSWSFLHGSIFHIFFNMAWLYRLGSMIEQRAGVLTFLFLFVVSGVAAGLLQYMATGPYFVGMSGFVYALFGYAWITGRFQPGGGIEVSKEDIQLMIVWFVICLFIGFVANSAHAGGLAVGMIFAYVRSGHIKRVIQYPHIALKTLKSPSLVLLLCAGTVIFESLF